MPRPTTKDELLTASAMEYDKLLGVLAGFPASQRDDIGWSAPIEDQSQNPRDVLTHLHAWHLMAIEWCTIGDAGGTPQVPGPGRTWRETPAINAEIWQRYASTTYAEALELLAGSHRDVTTLISAHSNEQLFTGGVYPWTRSTTLGAYFVSSTSAHYQWGVKTLRAIARMGMRPR
ncbi:MAG: ClbS/DfsB family four-helix bundle protein [Micropruina sp.]|nr:ClbS/DfsB family four-helix bundle protein [Micropruina sp.]